MRYKVYLTGALIMTVLAANAQTARTDMEQRKSITCKLTTAELQTRKATVIAELKTLVLLRRELEDGYAYEFKDSDEILDKLTLFIKTERMCCDFFTFQITVEDNRALLTMTGPKGTKEFLKEEVDF